MDKHTLQGRANLLAAENKVTHYTYMPHCILYYCSLRGSRHVRHDSFEGGTRPRELR